MQMIRERTNILIACNLIKEIILFELKSSLFWFIEYVKLKRIKQTHLSLQIVLPFDIYGFKLVIFKLVKLTCCLQI